METPGTQPVNPPNPVPPPVVDPAAVPPAPPAGATPPATPPVVPPAETPPAPTTPEERHIKLTKEAFDERLARAERRGGRKAVEAMLEQYGFKDATEVEKILADHKALVEANKTEAQKQAEEIARLRQERDDREAEIEGMRAREQAAAEKAEAMQIHKELQDKFKALGCSDPIAQKALIAELYEKAVAMEDGEQLDEVAFAAEMKKAHPQMFDAQVVPAKTTPDGTEDNPKPGGETKPKTAYDMSAAEWQAHLKKMGYT